MNRICKLSNIQTDENLYSKDRTVRKSCYNKNRKENNKNNILIQSQQSKVDNVNNNNDNNPSFSAYENHRNVFIGPSNDGQTYYMLKILENIIKKDLLIL